MMQHAMVVAGVSGMPTKKRAIVHLETVDTRLMMILATNRCRGKEVVYDYPCILFQQPIRLLGYAKQILAITEVQAKPKNHYVK
jgi:hypothetical protein